MDSRILLEHWITQYQNLIYSICYRLTGDLFDAEDLTQDTFLAAYQHLGSFDGQNEKAWLSRIATNKSIDYLKRAGRRSIPTEDIFFSSLPSGGDSPEETILQAELKDRLYRCCASLPEPYRDVALDYYYYEKEIDEIVKKTGKNKKTLQTQIYRAKGMLKQKMGKEVFNHG